MRAHLSQPYINLFVGSSIQSRRLKETCGLMHALISLHLGDIACAKQSV